MSQNRLYQRVVVSPRVRHGSACYAYFSGKTVSDHPHSFRTLGFLKTRKNEPWLRYLLNGNGHSVKSKGIPWNQPFASSNCQIKMDCLLYTYWISINWYNLQYWPSISHYYILIYRRKFRSQTSDSMDRWKKAEMGRVREKRSRREKIREEKESEERRCRCAKR